MEGLFPGRKLLVLDGGTGTTLQDEVHPHQSLQQSSQSHAHSSSLIPRVVSSDKTSTRRSGAPRCCRAEKGGGLWPGWRGHGRMRGRISSRRARPSPLSPVPSETQADDEVKVPTYHRGSTRRSRSGRQSRRRVLGGGEEGGGWRLAQERRPRRLRRLASAGPDQARAFARAIRCDARPRIHRCVITRKHVGLADEGHAPAGSYDPPFGAAAGDRTCRPVFRHGEDDDLARAEDALTRFHLDRLLCYAEDSSTWDKLSLVVFETVPDLVEARAIRRTWGEIKRRGLTAGKVFVISFVFPGDGGRYPVPAGSASSPSPEVVLQIALGPLGRGDGGDVEYARPDGIGINCTKPWALGRLVGRWTAALSTEDTNTTTNAPWLFLYPDGGSTYDVATRTWSDGRPGRVGPASGSSDEAEVWADELMGVASRAASSSPAGEEKWAGVVVGGCCKAGTRHVAALRRRVAP